MFEISILFIQFVFGSFNNRKLMSDQIKNFAPEDAKGFSKFMEGLKGAGRVSQETPKANDAKEGADYLPESAHQTKQARGTDLRFI